MKTLSKNPSQTAVQNLKNTVRYARPKFYISNQEDKTNISLLIPGVPKEKIDISIKNNQLIVKSDWVPTLENGEKFLIKQFTVSPFKAVFKLDDTLDQDSISATLENGVLNLSLSKKKSYTEVKKIEIS